MKGHEEGAQDEDGAKDMGMGTFCLALMIGILSRAWISKFVKLPYTVIVSARGPMNAQKSRDSGLFPCIIQGASGVLLPYIQARPRHMHVRAYARQAAFVCCSECAWANTRVYI